MPEKSNEDEFPHPDPVAEFRRQRADKTTANSRRIGITLVIASLLLYFFFPMLLTIELIFGSSGGGGHVSNAMILGMYAQVGFLASAIIALIASFYVRWAFFLFCIEFGTACMCLGIVH